MGNKTERFVLEFPERILLSEILSYENVSFLPVSNFIINNEIIFQDGQPVIFRTNKGFVIHIESVNNNGVVGAIFSSSDSFYKRQHDRSKEKHFWVVRQKLCAQLLLNNSPEVSVIHFPDNKFYNKIFFYGEWHEGLSDYLKRIMNRFIYTRRICYQEDMDK